MNNLKINLTSPPLSQLTPVAPNTYLVPVKFFNSTGGPLNSIYIPNTYVATVVTTTTNFDVNVPVQDETFAIDDVTIKAFTDNVTSCCFATGVYDLVNTGSGSGAMMRAYLLDSGYPLHLNMDWSGTSGNWVGQDLSTVTAPPGYKIRYYIGSEIIITSTPLVNYSWQSNNMITIQKALIKDDVNDLYFWGLNSGDPLRRPDDGFTMSGNTSFAFQSWIFTTYNAAA